MDTYQDTYAKVALAMTSAQKAKEGLVDELGIGEDLPFNFFGWAEDQLVLVIQCSRQDMKLSVGIRLEKCVAALEAMRRYWGCDEITLVAEGYQSRQPKMLSGDELIQAFTDQSSEIEEVLTATHIELDDFGVPVATLISIPYQYLLGRHVVWGDALGFERGVGDIILNAKIPATIAKCILEYPDPNVINADLDRITGVLMENGFNVQEF